MLEEGAYPTGFSPSLQYWVIPRFVAISIVVTVDTTLQQEHVGVGNYWHGELRSQVPHITAVHYSRPYCLCVGNLNITLSVAPICQDFQHLMTIVAEQVGLLFTPPLPHKPVRRVFLAHQSHYRF